MFTGSASAGRPSRRRWPPARDSLHHRPGSLTAAARAEREAEAGVDRIVSAVSQAMTAAERLGVQQLYVFTTSAVRDAANRDLILDRVETGAGVRPQYLAGVDEGRLTYLAVHVVRLVGGPAAGPRHRGRVDGDRVRPRRRTRAVGVAPARGGASDPGIPVQTGSFDLPLRPLTGASYQGGSAGPESNGRSVAWSGTAHATAG
ncbi:MAG TPA: hypothetical protein VHV09_10775 [Trebonia sp.]|nr:hypothetical protein [Trebonia sp.]